MATRTITLDGLIVATWEENREPKGTVEAGGEKMPGMSGGQRLIVVPCDKRDDAGKMIGFHAAYIPDTDIAALQTAIGLIAQFGTPPA